MLIWFMTFCPWLLIGLWKDRQLPEQGMCGPENYAHTETLDQMSFWRKGFCLDQKKYKNIDLFYNFVE